MAGAMQRIRGPHPVVFDDEVDLHAARAVVDNDVLRDPLSVVLTHLTDDRHLRRTPQGTGCRCRAPIAVTKWAAPCQQAFAPLPCNPAPSCTASILYPRAFISTHDWGYTSHHMERTFSTLTPSIMYTSSTALAVPCTATTSFSSSEGKGDDCQVHVDVVSGVCSAHVHDLLHSQAPQRVVRL